MQLYNLDHSPYATRIRIQIAKKDIPVSIVEIPLALKTPEFLNAFPLGKIPLLAFDDGECLPESIPIMEYLEERFPEPLCYPSDATARAYTRVLMSFTDTHLGPAMLPFFKALLLPDFALDSNEQFSVVATTLDKLDRWLAKFYVSDGTFEKDKLDMGDMVLAPTLWYVKTIVPLFCEGDVFAGLDTVNHYWRWVNQDQDVGKEVRSMANAFNQFMEAR
jgi:glutathione S-transferase